MELLSNKLHISCGQIATTPRWRQAALPQVGPPVLSLDLWQSDSQAIAQFITQQFLREVMAR
jgi:hypothetical protein